MTIDIQNKILTSSAEIQSDEIIKLCDQCIKKCLDLRKESIFNYKGRIVAGMRRSWWHRYWKTYQFKSNDDCFNIHLKNMSSAESCLWNIISSSNENFIILAQSIKKLASVCNTIRISAADYSILNS